jgi:hypothetical protein
MTLNKGELQFLRRRVDAAQDRAMKVDASRQAQLDLWYAREQLEQFVSRLSEGFQIWRCGATWHWRWHQGGRHTDCFGSLEFGMQGEDNVSYDNDPHLISVQKERKRLEQEVDDIIWDHGVNDPRLSALVTELQRMKELDEQGVIYEPTF